MPDAPSARGDIAMLQSLGALVHSLYRAAHSEGIRNFDALLFTHLKDVLPFDGAWLGHSTITPAGPVLHSNVLYQLAPDYVQCWETVQAHDPLVHEALGRPGLPAVLAVDQAYLHADFRAFLLQFGIAQVLCTTSVDPILRTCVHLSLYLHAQQPVFAPADRALLAAAMPNLASAIAMNRMRELERIHTGHTATRTGVAMVSRKGVIQYASPGFGDFMRLEWPDWPGGILPVAILEAVTKKRIRNFSGTRISAECETSGDLLIVTVRSKSRTDTLTPRERLVALQFAQGNSYKEVARTLCMAPSTVRHHLRQAYTKLQIQDKGAIAWALSQDAQKT